MMTASRVAAEPAGCTCTFGWAFAAAWGLGHAPEWGVVAFTLNYIPVIGPVFFVGKPIFFTMLVLVLLTHVVLFYTRFGLRMQLATQQLANTSQLKKVRRDIARVRTVMKEKAAK